MKQIIKNIFIKNQNKIYVISKILYNITFPLFLLVVILRSFSLIQQTDTNTSLIFWGSYFLILYPVLLIVIPKSLMLENKYTFMLGMIYIILYYHFPINIDNDLYLLVLGIVSGISMILYGFIDVTKEKSENKNTKENL